MAFLALIRDSIIANFAIQTIGAAISIPFKTEKYYDAFGASTFVACTLLTLARNLTAGGSFIPPHPRQIILTTTTTIWATRLFLFLFSRVHTLKGDRRFDKIKNQPLRFFAVWMIQGVWVTLVGLPAYAVAAVSPVDQPPLGLTDYAGLGLWTLGFIFEATADAQKLAWQKKLGDSRFNKFISTGMWSLCRYPNYFGEITLWFGSYLMGVSAFPGSLVAKYTLAASPLLTTFLLTKLSGIPLQEKQAKERFKNNVEYAQYTRDAPNPFPTHQLHPATMKIKVILTEQKRRSVGNRSSVSIADPSLRISTTTNNDAPAESETPSSTTTTRFEWVDVPTPAMNTPFSPANMEDLPSPSMEKPGQQVEEELELPSAPVEVSVTLPSDERLAENEEAQNPISDNNSTDVDQPADTQELFVEFGYEPEPEQTLEVVDDAYSDSGQQMFEGDQDQEPSVYDFVLPEPSIEYSSEYLADQEEQDEIVETTCTVEEEVQEPIIEAHYDVEYNEEDVVQDEMIGEGIQDEEVFEDEQQMETSEIEIQVLFEAEDEDYDQTFDKPTTEDNNVAFIADEPIEEITTHINNALVAANTDVVEVSKSASPYADEEEFLAFAMGSNEPYYDQDTAPEVDASQKESIKAISVPDLGSLPRTTISKATEEPISVASSVSHLAEEPAVQKESLFASPNPVDSGAASQEVLHTLQDSASVTGSMIIAQFASMSVGASTEALSAKDGSNPALAYDVGSAASPEKKVTVWAASEDSLDAVDDGEDIDESVAEHIKFQKSVQAVAEIVVQAQRIAEVTQINSTYQLSESINSATSLSTFELSTLFDQPTPFYSLTSETRSIDILPEAQAHELSETVPSTVSSSSLGLSTLFNQPELSSSTPSPSKSTDRLQSGKSSRIPSLVASRDLGQAFEDSAAASSTMSTLLLPEAVKPVTESNHSTVLHEVSIGSIKSSAEYLQQSTFSSRESMREPVESLGSLERPCGNRIASLQKPQKCAAASRESLGNLAGPSGYRSMNISKESLRGAAASSSKEKLSSSQQLGTPLLTSKPSLSAAGINSVEQLKSSAVASKESLQTPKEKAEELSASSTDNELPFARDAEEHLKEYSLSTSLDKLKMSTPVSDSVNSIPALESAPASEDDMKETGSMPVRVSLPASEENLKESDSMPALVSVSASEEKLKDSNCMSAVVSVVASEESLKESGLLPVENLPKSTDTSKEFLQEPAQPSKEETQIPALPSVEQLQKSDATSVESLRQFNQSAGRLMLLYDDGSMVKAGSEIKLAPGSAVASVEELKRSALVSQEHFQQSEAESKESLQNSSQSATQTFVPYSNEPPVSLEAPLEHPVDEMEQINGVEMPSREELQKSAVASHELLQDIGKSSDQVSEALEEPLVAGSVELIEQVPASLAALTEELKEPTLPSKEILQPSTSASKEGLQNIKASSESVVLAEEIASAEVEEQALVALATSNEQVTEPTLSSTEQIETSSASSNELLQVTQASSEQAPADGGEVTAASEVEKASVSVVSSKEELSDSATSSQEVLNQPQSASKDSLKEADLSQATQSQELGATPSKESLKSADQTPFEQISKSAAASKQSLQSNSSGPSKYAVKAYARDSLEKLRKSAASSKASLKSSLKSSLERLNVATSSSKVSSKTGSGEKLNQLSAPSEEPSKPSEPIDATPSDPGSTSFNALPASQDETPQQPITSTPPLNDYIDEPTIQPTSLAPLAIDTAPRPPTEEDLKEAQIVPDSAYVASPGAKKFETTVEATSETVTDTVATEAVLDAAPAVDQKKSVKRKKPKKKPGESGVDSQTDVGTPVPVKKKKKKVTRPGNAGATKEPEVAARKKFEASARKKSDSSVAKEEPAASCGQADRQKHPRKKSAQDQPTITEEHEPSSPQMTEEERIIKRKSKGKEVVRDVAPEALPAVGGSGTKAVTIHHEVHETVQVAITTPFNEQMKKRASAAHIFAEQEKNKRKPSWGFFYSSMVKYFKYKSSRADSKPFFKLPRPIHIRIRKVKIPRREDLLLEGMNPSDATGLLKAEWLDAFAPPSPETSKIIIYVHGGPNVFGNRKTHRTVTWRLSKYGRCRVLSLDYRHTNDRLYPLAMHDMLSAYLYLIDPPAGSDAVKYDPSQICFAGDSAGGNLALTTMLWLRDSARWSIPAGVGLISPWLDLTHSSPSYVFNGPYDYLPPLPPSKVVHSSERKPEEILPTSEYLHNPLVSPLFAKENPKKPICPVLIQVGDAERLRDESLEFYLETFRKSMIRLEVYEDMVHDWHLFSAQEASGRMAIRKLSEFFIRIYASTPAPTPATFKRELVKVLHQKGYPEVEFDKPEEFLMDQREKLKDFMDKVGDTSSFCLVPGELY
ncbi:hypothetical protein HDV05_002131 [Chytridiales sp. JEL 0842]|nr:hypothetical protein HDV05_002131 [Chytridiales sp. JEL 0842]